MCCSKTQPAARRTLFGVAFACDVKRPAASAFHCPRFSARLGGHAATLQVPRPPAERRPEEKEEEEEEEEGTLSQATALQSPIVIKYR